MDVPAGDKLAFALLKKGDLELMYGTYASLQKDLGDTLAKGPSFLFAEVEKLDDFVNASKGAEMVADVHDTFLRVERDQREGSGRSYHHVRPVRKVACYSPNARSTLPGRPPNAP